MKTIITTAVLLFAIASAAFPSNYEETMKAKIQKMYEVKNAGELSNLANQFQRIANAEPEKWLPNYYAAYSLVRSTFFDDMKNDNIHQQLDLAQTEIDKAKKKAPKESEIYALQAFVYQLRITDMSKGYKYSKLAGEAIGTAERLNPENPRVYYLRGSNTFHTPKMFGGGAANAKPDLEKAAGMFEAQKPESEIAPSWGAEHNKQLLQQCE